MHLQISKEAKERLSRNGVPDLLSVQQTREILGIGRISVYHLIETGQLPAFQKGRAYKIPKCGVICFLNKWEQNGGQ